jgi:hypothetical protein
MSLFGGVRPAAVVGDEIRVEARKYANLAIEVLGSIATRGETEGARVSAAKSLLDRGVGTVQVAKVPEGLQPKTSARRKRPPSPRAMPPPANMRRRRRRIGQPETVQ